MSVPIPPPLDELGRRCFSFYPAIVGIESNEWQFRRATWSEVLVYNTVSGEEIWIPRRFLGELSRVDEPVVIVGLLKELECRGGAVFPHDRRLIEMPRAVNDFPRPAPVAAPQPHPHPAPVVGIKLEPGAESRLGRMLLAAVAAGILTCIVVIIVARDSSRRFVFTPVEQVDLSFTADDDYYAVVDQLGPPAEDRWRSGAGELQYRLLHYPKRHFSVILMGHDRKDARYLGAMNDQWRVVHSVDRDAAALLRHLQRF
jgi:hypothetical protein